MARRRTLGGDQTLAMELLNDIGGPFAIIGQTKKKYEQLNGLIEKLVQGKMEIVVVKNFPMVIDWLRFKLVTFKSYRTVIYSLSTVKDINIIAKIIKQTIWHKTRFYILVGDNGFSKKLVELLSENNYDVNHAEEQLESQILGYFEPLDGEMYLYGNEKVKDIIVNACTDQDN